MKEVAQRLKAAQEVLDKRLAFISRGSNPNLPGAMALVDGFTMAAVAALGIPREEGTDTVMGSYEAVCKEIARVLKS